MKINGKGTMKVYSIDIQWVKWKLMGYTSLKMNKTLVKNRESGPIENKWNVI